jgi:hypothetical protein
VCFLLFYDKSVAKFTKITQSPFNFLYPQLPTGKAFYDIAHAPANHSNRRRKPKDYAVWEIHPVMKMEVIQ